MSKDISKIETVASRKPATLCEMPQQLVSQRATLPLTRGHNGSAITEEE